MELEVDDYISVFRHEISACYCNSCWGIWLSEKCSVDLVLC